MEKFAKIIETQSGHQVLVTKEFESEDDSLGVKITTRHEGIEPSITLGFDSEAKRDKMFEEFDENNAQRFIDNIVKELIG